MKEIERARHRTNFRHKQKKRSNAKDKIRSCREHAAKEKEASWPLAKGGPRHANISWFYPSDHARDPPFSNVIKDIQNLSLSFIFCSPFVHCSKGHASTASKVIIRCAGLSEREGQLFERRLALIRICLVVLSWDFSEPVRHHTPILR